MNVQELRRKLLRQGWKRNTRNDFSISIKNIATNVNVAPIAKKSDCEFVIAITMDEIADQERAEIRSLIVEKIGRPAQVLFLTARQQRFSIQGMYILIDYEIPPEVVD